MRLTEAERPHCCSVGLGACVIDLVGDEQDGYAGLAQHAHHGLVGVERADGGIDHEEDHIRVCHRPLRLGGDLRCHAAGVALPATRVHEEEPTTVPVRFVAHAIPRHPGHILDDGLAASQDAIDQRGLADIGAPDDCHDGE